ncbi:MAG: glycoside hydrolase family 5 protein [Treponema sp.]|nr:glycoside hydrolase family 5 protein [Treponema sp.]
MGNLDALNYFRAEWLNVGWNAGNTLDAYSNGVSGETKWGNPPLNQNLFIGLKEAGYNLVRIPITWMGHIGEAPDYPIEPDFLKRVAEVVGYAHQAALTVIINIHHDGHTDNNGKDAGWLSINKARASEDGMRQVTAQFERVWAQIATYFKNYGDYLIFEDMNEIHDGTWGWGPEPTQKPQYEIVNQWNQVFVNTVRNTGGNNLTRYLVVPGYCAVGKHTVADYFRLPQDQGKVNKLIVSFHYYDPYEFGIAGTRNEWGSTADKNKVSNDFQPFASWFIAMGIPVIIGESGAVRHPGYEQTRLDYLAYVYGKAHEFGLTPIYWDNGAFSGSGENFGLINRRTGQPDSDEAKTVIETMVNATK